MKKLFLRSDWYELVSSHEFQENDLNDYAMYTRIGDDVIRIHEFHEKENMLSFNFITPISDNIGHGDMVSTIRDIKKHKLMSNNKKIYKLIDRNW